MNPDVPAGFQPLAGLSGDKGKKRKEEGGSALDVSKRVSLFFMSTAGPRQRVRQRRGARPGIRTWHIVFTAGSRRSGPHTPPPPPPPPPHTGRWSSGVSAARLGLRPWDIVITAGPRQRRSARPGLRSLDIVITAGPGTSSPRSGHGSVSSGAAATAPVASTQPGDGCGAFCDNLLLLSNFVVKASWVVIMLMCAVAASVVLPIALLIVFLCYLNLKAV
ncbi:hypothetical protein C2845_PM10G20570 [Panicum miliaceum]|uniref:Uncharacterized protein n=1 Tax=Panicum miliaceum TaxID=4540 RepID=A0A3L6PDZ2_PANMI|nr:hypothetical protein C2845_PM10G20570 [Panicum miliaceum]